MRGHIFYQTQWQTILQSQGGAGKDHIFWALNIIWQQYFEWLCHFFAVMTSQLGTQVQRQRRLTNNLHWIEFYRKQQRKFSFFLKFDFSESVSIFICGLCRNVIDVGALDSHNLEQHEYKERMKHYAQRLAGGSNQQWHPNPPSSLLQDVPAPERLLAADPLSHGDLVLVRHLGTFSIGDCLNCRKSFMYIFPFVTDYIMCATVRCCSVRCTNWS